MNKKLTLFLLIFVLFQTVVTRAQDLIENSDLSTLEVDNLSDADIATFRSQLQAKNLTIDEVMPLALGKGMTSEEFTKLKSRLGSSSIQENGSRELGSTRKQEAVQNIKVKANQNSLIFGF